MSSGLQSQLGYSKETTYGTRVVPATFAEFDSETMTDQPSFLSSSGLRAGRLSPPIARHGKTVQSAGGAINLKVPNKGFGPILNLLHGNTVTPVQQGATAAYLQTHNIGTTRPTGSGKQLTIQIGKPGSGGTVHPFDFLGCKLVNAGFSCELGAELMAALEFDARQVKTDQTLASASYPTAIGSFDFTEGTVTVGGADIGLVSSFSLSIPIPMKTDRHGLGSGGLKREPIVNDYIRPTAQLGLEFEDLDGYNHFVNGDEVAVVCDFQGAIIASTYREQIKFTLAACKITGETPSVGGPDVLAINMPVEVYDDGTNPPVKIEYQAIDTSI